MPKLCDPDRDWGAYFSERCVVNERGCWVWTRFIGTSGYGRLSHRYAGQSQWWGAHRLAWTAFRGPIPDGLTVDHLCFVPACCNPDHLRLLTVSENCSAQRKSFKTHCHNGHEFTPENTRISERGTRECRRCRADRMKRRRAAHRAGVAS